MKLAFFSVGLAMFDSITGCSSRLDEQEGKEEREKESWEEGQERKWKRKRRSRRSGPEVEMIEFFLSCSLSLLLSACTS